MSLAQDLIKDTEELCYHWDKVSVPDNQGGTTPKYRRGAPFYASFAYRDSTEARIGAAQGVKALWDVMTARNVTLQYHDVFERVSTGQIYRATADNSNNQTPPNAGLFLRNVPAEEWNIPENDIVI